MNQPSKVHDKLMPHSISHSKTKPQLPLGSQDPEDGALVANTILQVALNNRDSTKILGSLATELGALFNAELCIIITLEGDALGKDETRVWQSEARLSESEIKELTQITLDSEIGRPGIITARTTLFNSIDSIIADIFPHQTWLGICTQFQQQTNGLVLLLKSQVNDWTQEERTRLAHSANSLAIAIAQAQLQQESRTRTRYQNLLRNLSQQISQSYHPKLLLENCLAEIGHALGLDRGLILLFKYQNPLKARDRKQDSVRGTAKITCQWSSQSPAADSNVFSFPLESSALCQQAWQQAPDSLYFNARAAFPDVAVDSVATKGEGLLMMPLMGKKTSETDLAMVLGLLVLQTDMTHHWSQSELELVSWTGVQISTAITHDQTLNRVQFIVEERTAQLKSSMDMQGKLSAKMRQHIEQLQKLHQLKDDFMNSMSHELKTPLTSMKLAIKMLRQSELPPAMREKYLDILEQEWNREYSLIKDLLTLQQVESGELDYSPQELDLAATIADLSQAWQLKWQSERDLNLLCNVDPQDLKIHTDAESLKQILQELLSNASKYCDPHTTIKLSATSQLIDRQEQVVIAVTNLGAGITAAELPHIFDKFRRGQGVTDRAVPGTGLGLTLVQYLVEHLNGTIEVTSEPTEEMSVFTTTFLLKLPQIQPAIS
ncbi:MAG: ATP-binding protein [Cyanobacteria bacterium J06623_7]